MYFFYI